jgi:hypothetical protein
MNKLAIVGSHPRTRDAAPWNDQRYDIWIFNEAAQSDWCKRVTGVFQLHVPAIYQNPNNMSNKGHWPWLQSEHDFTIWMQQKDASVPASVRYPLEEICTTLLPGFYVNGKTQRYFTSTPALSLALAIYLGYEQIDLYGWEMDSNTEYAYQREGVLFWLGEAHGRDIVINLHCMEKIFDAPVYGYEGSMSYNHADFMALALDYKAQAQAVKAKIKPLDFDADLIPQIEQLDLLTYEMGVLEGRCYAAARYEAKTHQLEKDGKPTILDRSEFEVSGALQKNVIEDNGALAARSLGWIDAALSVHQQIKSAESLQSLKDHINAHIQYKHATAYAMGIFEENRKYQFEYDKLLQAAGGMKSLTALKGA